MGLLRRIRLGPGRGIDRPVTMLRIFLFASAVILVAGGFVLSWVLTQSITSQAVELEQSNLIHEVDGFLRPELVHDGRVNVGAVHSRTLLRIVREQPELVTIKVWRVNGVLSPSMAACRSTS